LKISKNNLEKIKLLTFQTGKKSYFLCLKNELLKTLDILELIEKL